MIFYRISELILLSLIQRYNKNHFIFDAVPPKEILQAVRCHNVTIYDRIYTIYQFIKPFLKKNVYFFWNMKPLTFHAISQ